MKEQDLQHGAISIHPLHRKIRKLLRKKRVKGMGVDWNKPLISFRLPIDNQTGNDSCSGQAGNKFLTLERMSRGLPQERISAKSIYDPIACKGGGTTVVALQKQIKLVGANLEASVPSYDAFGNPLSEAMMTAYYPQWDTPELKADALTRAGYTLVDCGETIEDVAETIRDYKAVIWEIQGQDNGSWTSSMPTPPSASNPNEIWNHFMCCFDYGMLNGKKVIAAYQSMGEGWGDKGIQYFGEDYFNTPYIVDAFTFEYNGSIQVPVMPSKALWASLSDWFSGWKALSDYFKTVPAS